MMRSQITRSMIARVHLRLKRRVICSLCLSPAIPQIFADETSAVGVWLDARVVAAPEVESPADERFRISLRRPPAGA